MNTRDTAIILSALRLAQENLERLNAMPQMDETKGQVVSEEIDDLCERVNFGYFENV